MSHNFSAYVGTASAASLAGFGTIVGTLNPYLQALSYCAGIAVAVVTIRSVLRKDKK